MRMTIQLTIDVPQGSSPYEQTKAAIDALARSVNEATPEAPALGGVLFDALARRVGSYLVEFPG